MKELGTEDLFTYLPARWCTVSLVLMIFHEKLVAQVDRRMRPFDVRRDPSAYHPMNTLAGTLLKSLL
jgi:cobalamin biosynthesis protein CobD/CbiB